MRPRVMIGQLLIRVRGLMISLGMLIERLSGFTPPIALMVMRPNDLVEISRKSYSREKTVKYFCEKNTVDSGLTSNEIDILEKIPFKKGKLLLLGVGGGREAIYFSRIGYEVKGVDFIPEMVKRAKENADLHGVKIEGLVQEISKLDLPESSNDIIWLSAGMYSCVPTKKRRIEMLYKIKKSLNTGGYFVNSFFFDKQYGICSPIREFMKKALAFITLGNIWYERGDVVTGNAEFLHYFSSIEELSLELETGGFEVVHVRIADRSGNWSLALLTKKI